MTKAYGAGANTTGYDIVDDDPLKLKPYLISDFGLTIGINKGMGTFTAGVKNVFDTVYYDYYNNDRSAVVLILVVISAAFIIFQPKEAEPNDDVAPPFIMVNNQLYYK